MPLYNFWDPSTLFGFRPERRSGFRPSGCSGVGAQGVQLFVVASTVNSRVSGEGKEEGPDCTCFCFQIRSPHDLKWPPFPWAPLHNDFGKTCVKTSNLELELDFGSIKQVQ